jgi:mRNA interferase RelE/StbE
LTYEIARADEAFAAAEVFSADDPAGLAAVFDAVDGLTEDPRPPQAFQWSNTDYLRLRIGRYRVLYQIDDDEDVIRIEALQLSRSG